MTPFMSSFKRVKHLGNSTVTDIPVLNPVSNFFVHVKGKMS